MRNSFTRFMTSVAAFSLLTVASAQAEFNLDHPHVPGELIVKFKEGHSFQQAGFLQNFAAESKDVFSSSGAELLQFSSLHGDADLLKIARELSKDPSVEYVEANTIYTLENLASASETVMSDDPRFSELFGLHNTGQNGGTVDADIDAPEAWQISTGSHDTLVGILDTGIDYNHPDLVDNVWTNPGESGLDADGNDKRTNGLDDDGNGYVDDFRGWDFFNDDNDPMDGHGHGSHCAGTIGATGNNGTGVVGVNWTVSMVAMKIFSDQGRTSADKIIRAVEYSTSLGVHMTSNSWGGGPRSEALRSAIAQAGEADILFIAAAGNSRNDNDNRTYFPSGYELDNIIAVASTDRNDRRSGFSSFGATTVDIGAPGSDILSTVPGGYRTMSGTSMATPHVSGLAALIKSTYPEATAAAVKARILGGGDPITALAGKALTGARINALNSLENDSTPPNLATGLEVSDATPYQVTLNWRAAGDDGENGYASTYEIFFSANQMNDDNLQEAQLIHVARGTAGVDELSTTLNMDINTEGFLAIRSADNLGNVGGLSQNIAVATVRLNVFYVNQADGMAGMSADAPWGLEVTEEGSFFSDSPEGNYEDNLDISLTTDMMSAPGSSVTLALKSMFDFERRHDWGHVEISTDGTTWQSVTKYNQTEGLETRLHPLDEFLGDSTSFQLRFRVTTDRSITKQGWKIDNFQLLAPAE